MSSEETIATVDIYRMIGDGKELGVLVATVKISDYKSAISNAARAFAREFKPAAGRYAAVTKEQYGDKSGLLIFNVKAAEAVLTINGRQDLLGGDHGWGAYTPGEVEWSNVDDASLVRARIAELST